LHEQPERLRRGHFSPTDSAEEAEKKKDEKKDEKK
jgi:hypothetical protein